LAVDAQDHDVLLGYAEVHDVRKPIEDGAPLFFSHEPKLHRIGRPANPRFRSIAVDFEALSTYYLFMTGINTRALDRELKRGSAELLILSLLDARPRHGYELSKLIHTRSGGQLTFHIDSLYPLLYRLEERGWIKGTWVEKPDERRRRFYKVTAEGQRVLAQQRKTWAAFVEAVRRVTGDEHA
jgi:PadR family transcriptional regulator, regulatory protein PadR